MPGTTDTKDDNSVDDSAYVQNTRHLERRLRALETEKQILQAERSRLEKETQTLRTELEKLMIHIGYSNNQKIDIIKKYINDNGVNKTVVISPIKFPFIKPFESDDIEYLHLIDYPIFYRLLQEINPNTLIVLNECLRTQDRNCLHYNCIRHFLNQTSHQLIFNQLPIIDTQEDFMILFDFDTQSRWKRTKFNLELIKKNL